MGRRPKIKRDKVCLKVKIPRETYLRIKILAATHDVSHITLIEAFLVTNFELVLGNINIQNMLASCFADTI